MSRNMIDANKKLFATLDKFCNARGDPVLNAGQPRWIETTAAEKGVLKNAKLTELLTFTARKGLARFDLSTKTIFCSVGFDHLVPSFGLSEDDVNAGLLTAILFELDPLPRASAAEIKNIIEADDPSINAGYAGHTSAAIKTLYPTVRAFSAYNISPDETWRLFFLICLLECRNAETWIDEAFANALQGLAELQILNLPYRTLCRSIFDTDRGAMFLALYRCLEALYAFSSARALMATLKLSNTWEDIASALEDVLGWHPREESSLADLISLGIDRDQTAIFAALNEPLPDTAQNPLSTLASRRIYRLRNDLVHFRPAQHRVDLTKIEWNRLCEAMTGLICFIYADVFGPF